MSVISDMLHRLDGLGRSHEAITRRLDVTNDLLAQILIEQKALHMPLTRLAASVSKIVDAAEAAKAVLSKIADEVRAIKDANDVNAAADALADKLDAESDSLSQAIVANTPADPNAPQAANDAGAATQEPARPANTTSTADTGTAESATTAQGVQDANEASNG